LSPRAQAQDEHEATKLNEQNKYQARKAKYNQQRRCQRRGRNNRDDSSQQAPLKDSTASNGTKAWPRG